MSTGTRLTDPEALRASFRTLAEYRYEKRPVVRGYNDRILYVNIGTLEIREKPVSGEMKARFTGGKGYGMRLLWDALTPASKWDDPENEINITTGPVCGNTSYPGSGKSLVVSLSPLTGVPIDSNVGGHFGPYLKFSGFDALEVQGKAREETIVLVDGDEGVVRIVAAPGGAVDSHLLAEEMVEVFSSGEADRQHVSSVSAGSGADHALVGCLNFSFYDKRRKVARLKQAGRGGIGTVFRDKKLRALVVKCSSLDVASNDPADLPKLQATGLKLHREIISLDDQQCRMREIGTAHLTEIMDEYDLLPTHNFKYGSHPEAAKIDSHHFVSLVTQGLPDGCWFGCTLACAKAADGFELLTGPYAGDRVTVDGPEYETVAGCGSNIGVFDARAVLEINFYCDTYGIDTISFGTLTAFCMECWEKGVLDADRTGGLVLEWGNWRAVLEMLHQMARGEGFGVIAGMGVRRMKKHFAERFGADPALLQDIGCECKGLEYSQYVSKESLAQQGGYSMALKGPQHDEAWLIFMDMVNNRIPTFEDKAEALYYFPMFRTWFGLQGLCKLPWNDIEPADNAQTSEPAKVPEHVRNYVDIFNAITGRSIDGEELIRQSARVYNFQKVLCLRMGRGRRSDDRPPYRMMGPVTVEEYESRAERYDRQLREQVGIDPSAMSSAEKVKALRAYREDRYEKLLDAVYRRKGWTPEGVPRVETLRDLGIDYPEVVEVVRALGG
jgi:aldehyde:ferredoxin oxidoreductase